MLTLGRRRLMTAMLVIAVAILTNTFLGARPAAAVEIPGAGMCNGRTDAHLLITAHANGAKSEVPKYILNLATDAAGTATGTLILGQGAQRLTVDEWCRAWRHLPGQPPGACGEYPEGATTAHAVGWGRLRDGRRVLVRTDVRGTHEGDLFRLRYRLPTEHDGEHESAAMEDEGGCEEGTWVKFPQEGWYPLDQLRVQILEAEETMPIVDEPGSTTSAHADGARSNARGRQGHDAEPDRGASNEHADDAHGRAAASADEPGTRGASTDPP